MQTTFTQEINGKRFQLTMPMARVTKVIDKVDAMIDAKQYAKAMKTIKPFIGQTVIAAKGANTGKFADIIAANRSDRKTMMDRLIEAGATKASAYYHIRKAGI